GYRALSNWIIGLAVFAFAAVTGVQTLLGKEQMRLVPASSRVAPVPTFDAMDRPYFSALADWSADNFWTRGPLVTLSAATRYFGFNSASDDRVLPGKDGWIFFGDLKYRQNVARDDMLSPQFKDRARSVLRERIEWLSQRGIAYVVAIGPAKHNIYPEKLSWRMEQAGGPSPQEAFLNELRNEGFPVIDTFSALRTAKETSPVPLYYERDSHWQNYGAGVVVHQIVDELPDLYPELQMQRAAWDVVEIQNVTPSFGRLMGIPFPYVAYDTGASESPGPRQQDGSEFCNLLNDGEIRRCWRSTRQNKPYRVLLLGDSYGNMMYKPTSLTFGEVLLVNGWNLGSVPEAQFPTDLIEAYEPDLVITLMAEYRFAPCLNGAIGTCGSRFGVPNPFSADARDDLEQLWRGPAVYTAEEDFDAGALTASGYRGVVNLRGEFEQSDLVLVKVTLPDGFEGQLIGAHLGPIDDGIASVNKIARVDIEDNRTQYLFVQPDEGRSNRYLRLASTEPLIGTFKTETIVLTAQNVAGLSTAAQTIDEE
ncbi:MAG: hypothetical protein AAFR74_00120, partial [Pseudomonadota bacterium]